MPDRILLDNKQPFILGDDGELHDVKKLMRVGSPATPAFAFYIPKGWLDLFNNVVKRSGKEEYWVKFEFLKNTGSYLITPLSETEATRLGVGPPATDGIEDEVGQP